MKVGTETKSHMEIAISFYVSVSHRAVDCFVKTLDIGEVHQIPGYSGVARTVTALTTMIADLNLAVPSLNKNLVWFNGNTNHFVVEFSDDGAPESKEVTMTIVTITLWNFRNRVRSREYHYPLHLISTTEKDSICENLWKQHADEMALIESNVVMINGEKITFEFQPSADQAWQCWAANCLPSSATFPSPYANVHKNDLKKIDGSISKTEWSTWRVPTMDIRNKEIEELEKFRNGLKKGTSPEVIHKKELAFMTDNGLRQLGEPRIGIFADRIRPESLHLEINNWQHVLDLIYKEAVRRRRFEEFVEVLQNPVKDSEKLGCGLKFIGMKIREHYNVESSRFKKLETRLIGAQAISLVFIVYSFRLIDQLITENESETQVLKRLALAKMCENLRDIGSQINRVVVENESYPEQVKILCRNYFNLFSLFFPESCQSTVWTMGYVLPYHVEQLMFNIESVMV